MIRDDERQPPNPWCLLCGGTGGKRGRCICTTPRQDQPKPKHRLSP